MDWQPVLGYTHPACCDKNIKDHTCTIPLYHVGCKDAFKEFVEGNILLVIGVAIGVGVLEVRVKKELVPKLY